MKWQRALSQDHILSRSGKWKEGHQKCLSSTSSHSVNDCVSAIHISLKKLEVSGLDMPQVEIHAITGGIGDGGVQNIYPPLKEIKVTNKESKKYSFQCHAFSKGLQNQYKKTFGELKRLGVTPLHS